MRFRAPLAVLTILALAVCGVTASASAAQTAESSTATTGVQSPDPQIVSFPPGTTRLSGADRYATAIEVSKRFLPGVPAVYIATGTNFPDALSAAAAAAHLGGPLLLTPGATLLPSVATEIQRLTPGEIFVVGGEGVMAPTTMTALARIAPTSRLGGNDRYSTGLTIVNAAFPSAEIAFIATGRSFPDALAASGAAGAQHAPVILVDGLQSSLSASTRATLERLDVARIAIAGGTGAVSKGIADELVSAGYQVTRHGGADRYETAARINSEFFTAENTSTYFLATGANFPDALAGAALAGRIGAPLFTTTAACTPSVTRSVINEMGATSRVVMGGSTIVSDVSVSNTGCLESSAPTISGALKWNATLSANAGNWTPGTAFTYQWRANGTAIAGATSASLLLTTAHVGKSISVAVTGTQSGFVGLTRVSASTAAISYPDRTGPVDSWNCPSWAPIKGNASSMIYHLPSGSFYERTNPEECFRTEAAAQAAGYRKSLR